jgi:RNA polymerase sigma-70 factor (ECF subfamily)
MEASPPDPVLVEAARGGDRGAFDALVRRHFRRVYALAFRLTGNHEDAEDLAQECFVRAYHALAWFRGDAGFATWLARIAVHLARDRRRRAGRRPAMLAFESAGEAARGLPDGSGPRRGSPEGTASRRELSVALAEAVRRLPGPLSEALVLRLFEGLDYDEVAAITGVRPGTVRTQVMKARKLLLRWLGPLLDRSVRP